jgi:hypothetical protein
MLTKQHLMQTMFDRAHVLLGAAAVILSPSKLASRLTNALNSSIPEGYEDETGFHYGSEPSKEEQP